VNAISFKRKYEVQPIGELIEDPEIEGGLQ
jgi:hypothetical protein